MERVVILRKATACEELESAYGNLKAAEFVFEQADKSAQWQEHLRDHERLQDALAAVRDGLPNDVQAVTVLREELPYFAFRDDDQVVVCGPDGLFANLAQYLRNQPVIGVNPNPDRIGGQLLPFHPQDVGELVQRTRKKQTKTQRLPLAQAKFDDDRVVYGFNDILLGRADRVSARYEIEFEGRREAQSSDGILVATGAGSTGWIRSVAAMVEGLTEGRQHALSSLPSVGQAALTYVVLNPYPSPSTGTSLVVGRVTPRNPLRLTSRMPKDGCVFSDGITEKPHSWLAGTTVEVSVGDRNIRRVVG